MKTITTSRLTLRRATSSDAPFLALLMNDPEYVRLIGDRGVRSEEDAVAYLASSPIYAYGDDGLGFNIAVLTDGTAIGICGLVKRAELDDVDLGYAIASQHAGKGYASEAASAVIQYAREDLGLERIVALTVMENGGSRIVLERIGMRLERIWRPAGSHRDSCLYCIP